MSISWSRESSDAYETSGCVFSTALSYRWLINEFPNFIRADDGRWFVSQVSGNLFLAKAEPNDTANYFCFTTINLDISTKSTFSKPIPLSVLPNGMNALNLGTIRLQWETGCVFQDPLPESMILRKPNPFFKDLTDQDFCFLFWQAGLSHLCLHWHLVVEKILKDRWSIDRWMSFLDGGDVVLMTKQWLLSDL